MKRLGLMGGILWFSCLSIGTAQTLPSVSGSGSATILPPATTAPDSVRRKVEPLPVPPAPLSSTHGTLATSPGEGPLSPEAQAYLRYVARDREQAEAVHRAAAARAEERTRRLEAQRWFGISNSRPMVGCDPYNSDYAPTWVSNNTFYPYRWVGGQTWVPVEGP